LGPFKGVTFVIQPFGFPREFLPLLRCPTDSGKLLVSQESGGDESVIVEGELRCATCSHQFQIDNGIVRLMKESLTNEDEHEMKLKNLEYEAMPEVFVSPPSGWRSEFMDRIEIPPHLAAIQPLGGRRVLELACGDGRFTILMAQQGADVLAIDIAIEGLRRVRSNFQAGTAPTSYKVAPLGTGVGGRVGLVQANASNLSLAPCSFDRALSATPLDSRDERMKMYRAVAEALNEGGRYIAGVEYDDLARRLLGLPKLRRYSPGGILIEHLDIPTLRHEMAPYFGRVRMKPIRVALPFVKRLRMTVGVAVAIARVAAVLPLLKHFGTILLACADRPIRLPVDGARRKDYLGARSLYRRLKRWRGEEPTWDWDQPV
jgi:SAM-dependent methyltransferase